ncbi:MAG: aminotransferase class I/II-fold pyridoxal phosphate-dependent enzyme [Marinoscillum sp.]|uniref:trans-sulfuration enzyme family protein n=1 Tax=Marinoscillum sp. TaxID=2024838 RepID=UPI0033046972
MSDKKFETAAIRHQIERSSQKEHSSPIYMTSSFKFDDAEDARSLFAEEKEGNIYSRYSNPNTDEFIQKLCLLEGAETGMAMASGMAAMFTSLAAFLSSGDHVVASRSLFGSTHQILTKLLPKWGISSTYVDILDDAGWEKAIQPNTKMIFLETPSNPALDLVDLEKICALGRSKGILVNVDNCFATPYLQNPIKWGADIVTHSATKFIDGQGRVIGGAIVTSEELFPEIKFMARHTGPSMSPFNGWLLSKSLETLAVRMDKHCDNALKLAQHLEGHSALKQVRYPFLPSFPQYELAKKQMRLGGGIVTFELKGGIDQGRKFLDALKMISLSANLGDTRTIATHPASTTHSKLSEEERLAVGITPGLVRVSVGLEHMDDIIADVEQALDRSK